MLKQILLSILAIVALSVTARGQVIHTRSVNLGNGDESVSLQVPKFNPAVGRLAGVRISIKSVVSGSINVENLARKSETVTADAFVGAALHGESVLVASPFDFRRVQRLAGFDGKLDYNGPSGAVMAFEGVSPTLSIEIMGEGDNLLPFIQSGKQGEWLDLTGQAVAHHQLHGARSVASELDVEVRMTVQVTYFVWHKIDDVWHLYGHDYGMAKPGKSSPKETAIAEPAGDDRNNDSSAPAQPTPVGRPRG